MAYKQLKFWFDKELAQLLADKIVAVAPHFNQRQFVANVHQKTGSLELKDRVECIADELYQQLGKDFKTGVAILMQIMGSENEEETGMFKTYYWLMPVAKYVEKYGLNDFKEAMLAIEEITKRNTGEYAIRPFIENHFEQTMEQLKTWSKEENKHLRRLSSEGVRPRLPWAKKLNVFVANPFPILPILNNLKDDPSKYVQKSVANCINDILKDNAAIGQQLIESWNKKGISKQRQWIIKHALRNLIKADNNWAKEMVETATKAS